MDRFDPKELMRKKEEARRQLDDDLVSGRVSREQLQQNSIFANVDFSKARIVLDENDPIL